MTDAELDHLERASRLYITLIDNTGTLEPRYSTVLHQARDIARDAVRAVDMVRAERSARRSIQEQRDAALARILASNPQEGA